MKRDGTFEGAFSDNEPILQSTQTEFNISRKTGYKLFNRYKECGIEALADRTRRPVRFGNQLPFQVEQTIVNLKRDKPSFGAPKIRELIIRRFPDVKPPAISTVHCVLDRYGLVTRRSRKRTSKATGTALSVPIRPNDLWCADYKGQFQLGNKQYCYPLTITDSAFLTEAKVSVWPVAPRREQRKKLQRILLATGVAHHCGICSASYPNT